MDDTVFFDQKPTHRPVPDWLIDAQSAADRAWDAYDNEIEKFLHHNVNHEAMAAALKTAKEAEDWLVDLRSMYLNGQTPASLAVSDSVSAERAI